MHLLRTEPGGFIDDSEGIARIEQTPADIVILSCADTELATLSSAVQRIDKAGLFDLDVRLANLTHLAQHASVDLYMDDVLQHAKIILVSLLGGKSYWPYGVEQLIALSRARGQKLMFVPGDDHFDEALSRISNVPEAHLHQCWRYLREGGVDNAQNLLAFIADDFSADIAPARAQPSVLVYHPSESFASLDTWHKTWRADAPVALLLFYRAHFMAANTAVIDSLCAQLQELGINPLPVAVASLKDPVCLETVNQLIQTSSAGIILNTTAFAISKPGADFCSPFGADIPVLQVILAASNYNAWQASNLGLMPRDLAMNIALPEVDGRIITRAVSFKGLQSRCALTQVDVAHYQPQPARIAFVAELAAAWLNLARRENKDKRIAFILANYPSREGRLGNGVGLDTPNSLICLLQSLQSAGYALGDLPEDGDALMARVQMGVTNDPVARALRPVEISVPLSDYERWYTAHIPEPLRAAVEARWGVPAAAPCLRDNAISIAGFWQGACFIGIQPARGYHLDLSATYHDPDLVPPHSYLAFYLWLRYGYRADALMHVGKHGNLEWLPGKSVALSEHCWPEAVFGPSVNIYPFIVNDPGEGAQAKRRTQAVIIDHLIPPLTRAETYGPLAHLERLVDEYYDALQLDPKRAKILRAELLALAKAQNLDREAPMSADASDDEDALIGAVDNYLCALKESQIRGGLHILGQAPEGARFPDTVVALLRQPRAAGKEQDQSILRALAEDFLLQDFDPLDCRANEPWQGPRPAFLQQICDAPWRSHGDTRERLELAALALVQAPTKIAQMDLLATQKVCTEGARVGQLIYASASGELDGCQTALAGQFVAPGPSGAPSRGRLDVLPTGRNFYSVDVRALPTITAWKLGWHSAAVLVERHLQEHGDYPRQIGLSVWGTATMRTGGDDIAQAMALLGVRPVWDASGARVTDFEVLPVEILDRPRIDVTLRVSGFFRDAFMNLVRLFDSAIQKVAELDEPDEDNPIAARVRATAEQLCAEGMAPEQAKKQASYRVFGSKPGSYGAGLQGLIDEGCWDTRADLAEAYVNWGGYAYGQTDEGAPAHEALRARLEQIDTVVHNQDNREHDLLDSDDYYQFQGGMAAAVATYSGQEAAVYHMDHSQLSTPRAYTLKEEINRIVRARVVNPKWIQAMQRHGYKGAFEMAATVDYLFAFDATAKVVDDYQYELLNEAFLGDPENLEFMRQHNPAAAKECAERLLEAVDRGMWAEPREADKALLQQVLSEFDHTWEASL